MSVKMTKEIATKMKLFDDRKFNSKGGLSGVPTSGRASACTASWRACFTLAAMQGVVPREQPASGERMKLDEKVSRHDGDIELSYYW